MKAKRITKLRASIDNDVYILIDEMYRALVEASYAIREMTDGTNLVAVSKAINHYELKVLGGTK